MEKDFGILLLVEYDPIMAEELRTNLVTTEEESWQRTNHFFEYFDAETGEGLGADHQIGWTALVANLIEERCQAIDDSQKRRISRRLERGARWYTSQHGRSLSLPHVPV